MRKWMQMLESWIGGGPSGGKRLQTFRWIIIIGLVGVASMIIHSFISVKEVDPWEEGRASPQSSSSQEVFLEKDRQEALFRNYEGMVEGRLKEMLEKIVGIGEVEVMVTIDSTEEILVERNTRDSQQVTNEKDSNGATRHITEVTRDHQVVLHEVSGEQQPIIIKTVKPKIRGVVVVARGAENLTVKKMIIEAVSRGLQVPPHRIAVAPRKQ